MDAEFRRMGSSDRLLQADAIAESYLRNLVVFYAGVALVFFGHGVVTANFALWNIDVLARGSDARASTYMMYGYVAYGACNVVGVPCISSLSDAVGRKRLLVFTLLASALAPASMYLAPRFWVFVVAFAVMGLLSVYAPLLSARRAVTRRDAP